MNLNPGVTNMVQAKYLSHIKHGIHCLRFVFYQVATSCKSARNHLFWGQDMTRETQWYTMKHWNPSRESGPADDIPDKFQLLENRSAPSILPCADTHKPVNIVSGKKTRYQRESYGDGVYPRHGGFTGSARPPLVSNVFPFAKHHLPRGLRVSIGPCCRPSRCSVELINREPWCFPPSLPARLAICHRSYGGWSVCTLPHFQKSGSRNKTTLGIVRSDQPAQTPENSDVAWIYWFEGRVFSHKRCESASSSTLC